MNVTINPHITVPLTEVHSTDSCVTVFGTTGSYVSTTSYSTGDVYQPSYTISLNPIYCFMIANAILNREMDYVRRNKCINVNDFSRIQNMLDSDEKELNDLAYSILEKYTKYVVPISKILNNRTLSQVTSDDIDNLNDIITTYLDNNKTNIEDILK